VKYFLTYNTLWPPLWSSGQSSWLQKQRSEYDPRHNQIFWEVVGLEWGPLSLVSTTEELLERKNICSGLESREYGGSDPSRWPCGTLYPQKLAVTSLKSGGCSVGIVRSLTKATEFFHYTILYSVKSQPTFLNIVSPPSSGPKNKQKRNQHQPCKGGDNTLPNIGWI
jgi:hypothetical protein